MVQLVIGIFVILICVGSWAIVMLRHGRVKGEMKEYAKANNLEWLGKKLPDGFVFRGTGLNNPEIADVMKGPWRDTEIVVFIARFWTKETTTVVRSQTVIAFPNAHHIGSRQIPPTGDPNFYFEVAGDWFVLYFRAGVIGKDQLPDWCEKMYAVTQKAVSGAISK
jgi:hypothetical protein